MNSPVKFGHDERHPVLHQTGDVVDVAAQPVELGTITGALVLRARSIAALAAAGHRPRRSRSR